MVFGGSSLLSNVQEIHVNPEVMKFPYAFFLQILYFLGYDPFMSIFIDYVH